MASTRDVDFWEEAADSELLVGKAKRLSAAVGWRWRQSSIWQLEQNQYAERDRLYTEKNVQQQPDEARLCRPSLSQQTAVHQRMIQESSSQHDPWVQRLVTQHSLSSMILCLHIQSLDILLLKPRSSTRYRMSPFPVTCVRNSFQHWLRLLHLRLVIAFENQ
ncbi:hypothetical protein BD289DRAFT_103584 [Coniella lustricola]|uniref:Uncharacterized protein n=1 Tax=Coniella lustricola TaxID=2025994 RepID=A0A2T2ZXY7_9PEZI|nr:hypothetical protein BD289DRAFT_103584 [Coniella lustricola]